MGPKQVRSSVLTAEEEAAIVAFRRYVLLPLDDCLKHSPFDALFPHRCLQRHGISRLEDVEGDKPPKKKFKAYPIGYFHIDIAEVQTEEGRLYLFVAIHRTSKFAYAELHRRATRLIARDFLSSLVEVVPYAIHTILPDNGIQFAVRKGTEGNWSIPFDRFCNTHGIEHRLTQVCHPWTNGQVERMNRTIKDATVKRYYYQTHEQLKAHLQTFLMAYNFGRRLKMLKGLTPCEFVCKIWTKDTEQFRINPIQHTVRLNT